ncbi:hypothetical protein BGZ59_007290 [Podila verticillata]|nr:hypothetical protein BGZ59_007290 [Podila verticillata]
MNGSMSTSSDSDSGSGTLDASFASPDFDITCKHEPAILACADEKHEEALSTPKESFPAQVTDMDLLTTTIEPASHNTSASDLETTSANTDILEVTLIHPTSVIDDTDISPTLLTSPNSVAEPCSNTQSTTTVKTEAMSSQLSQDNDNQPQEPVQGSFSEGYSEQEFATRLLALNVNIDTTETGLTPSSSSSPSSASTSYSSSSSLSEFLLIGQTEREDSEFDRHSEQSFESHDSFGERYSETLGTSNLSQSSTSTISEHTSRQRQSRRESRRESYRESRRENHRHSRVCDEEYEQYSDESFQDYHRHESSKSPGPQKERTTEFNSEHTSTSSTQFTDRPSSPANSERTRKRRSHRASPPPEESAPVSPAPSPMLPPLPALKLPSVRGIAKSMVELMIATMVCVSLVGVMFAFSYVSTGTKHLLGWYSDQRFGQRIRERIREREHFVQEALERMAGEEYVKIKRQGRPGQQQHGYASSSNQYNRQYYQDQHQEQPYERESLSNAEWQELIRAASLSFMAKFSSPGRH